MRTVYISDVTGKQYSSEEECKKAEEAVSTEKIERKNAAKKVEEKFDVYDKARKDALNELESFNKKYGEYRTGITYDDPILSTPFDWLFDHMFM